MLRQVALIVRCVQGIGPGSEHSVCRPGQAHGAERLSGGHEVHKALCQPGTAAAI